MRDELKFTFVTHACLKIEGSFGTLVCDPWILNEPIYNFSTWKFPAAVMEPSEVTKDVTHLLITHSHEDHFHVPSLDHFSRDVQVILPAYENYPCLRAHTVERTLRRMGFFNIRRYASWKSVALDESTKLTFVPTASNRDHDWENAGFVIETPDVRAINMNDCLTDRELCRKIKEQFHEFDIAFVQTAGVTMYPGCFRMTEEEMRKEASKRIHAFAEQKRIIEYLRPKRVAPFAGDFCWLDPKFIHNNWANRATPDIFDEMVKADYPDLEMECITFNPTDTWSKAEGVTRHHPPVDWDNYLDEITELQHRFMPKISQIQNWIESSDTKNLEARSRKFTQCTEQRMTRDDIFFEARIRLSVEGAQAGFSFVLKADYDNGFAIDWDDHDDVDQTLHVRQEDWAAVLEGKLMWNIIQWRARAKQDAPYRVDMGRFFFWMEYHIDGGDKGPQIRLESRDGSPLPPNNVQFGVFPTEADFITQREALTS